MEGKIDDDSPYICNYEHIDRSGSFKWLIHGVDSNLEAYPMTVADMDFKLDQRIEEDFKKKCSDMVLGYTYTPDTWK